MKHFTALLITPLLIGCSSSGTAADSSLGPVNDSVALDDIEAQDGPDTADVTLVDAVSGLDTRTETPLDIEIPPPKLDLCSWPAAEPAACDAIMSMNLAVPDHVAVSSDGNGGVVVVWSTGAKLSAVRIDGDGKQLGDTHVLTLESPISGLAAAPSEQMMMVFYSTGRLAEDAPEDVILRYRPIVEKGFGDAVILAENFELRPGGIPTIVGPRVQGITRQVKGDVIYDLVALTLLNHDGTVRTTHTVRVAEAFAYYRIHASGSRANYPYVDMKDSTVSYYEQSVHLLACGLPQLPSMVVKSDSKMLATNFWDGVAVWLVRNPEACNGSGSTRLTFHQTGPRISDHIGLGLFPSDQAAIAVRPDDGSAVVIDETDGVVTTVPFDVGSRLLEAPSTFTLGAEQSQPESLHPIPTDDGWLIARIGRNTDGSNNVSTWKNCGSK